MSNFKIHGSEIAAFFKRIYLLVRANWVDTFGDRASARKVWIQLYKHEVLWLRTNNPARATTMISLALTYMNDPQLTDLTPAETLLAQVQNRWGTSASLLTRKQAATASCLRARIAERLGDWQTAVQRHEEAEKLYFTSESIGWPRSHNLNELSRCYLRLGRPDDACRVERQATSIQASIFYNYRPTVLR